jgi:hypothetical protein
MKTSSFILGLGLIIVWLYLGISQDLFYEESHNVIFIKKYPTFKLFFLNPALTESDVLPIATWDTSKRNSLIEYCKYRFDITNTSPESLNLCSKLPYLSSHKFLNW